ncbi:portal protein [Bradyrhizobium ottawaense]|uniref:portal protein n=1 Tax=Bradyrhizobium ottawaense TaxID=931866 RepID=UPI0030F3B36D
MSDDEGMTEERGEEPKRMDLGTLQAMLSAEKANALAGLNASSLASERADAMAYYLGDMEKDMPSQPGRSKTVSTDVADVVEGLMPQLMDIFAGSDEVVRFEAVGPEDEEAAQQETDYVNHVFMQQNSGFMILYSFIKDALLQKTGVVKVWWDEREQETRETYYDMSEEQFALLAQDVANSNGAMEIVAHTMRTPDGSVSIEMTMEAESRNEEAPADEEAVY